MYTLGDAIVSLGIKNFVILGEPQNKEEFNSMFRRVIKEYPDRLPDMDSNPANFGITWVEVTTELKRLQEEYNSKEYQRLRAIEYPPVTDYLDAVVKGDLAQQQAYIDACLAVKAKYPKPEGA
jgi:hypothetical protein